MYNVGVSSFLLSVEPARLAELQRMNITHCIYIYGRYVCFNVCLRVVCRQYVRLTIRVYHAAMSTSCCCCCFSRGKGRSPPTHAHNNKQQVNAAERTKHTDVRDRCCALCTVVLLVVAVAF